MRLQVSGRNPRWPESVALFAYLVLGCILAFTHEAWRDEADSWLVVRDSSFPELLDWLGYGGVPGLWYVILFPLAKIGLPFVTQRLVHLIISVGVAGLVLFKAPFPLRTRLLITFSYFLGYEYLAIARNYALGILLLFLAAALDDSRVQRPVLYGAVLALMMNTAVHFLLIGLAIGFFVLVEELRKGLSRRFLAGAGVGIGGAVLAVWQLWPPLDGAHTGLFYTFEPSAFRWSITQAIVPGIPVGGLHWIGFPVMIGLVVMIARHRRALLTFLLAYSGLLYLMMFKVVGGLRHFGLVFAIIVYALWLQVAGEGKRAEGDKLRWARIAFEVTLVVAVATSAVHWYLEVMRPFSGASHAARFIREAGLAEAPIAADEPAAGSAVLVHLEPRQTFWYPALGRTGSFMSWDKTLEESTRFSPETIGRRVVAERVDALFLSNRELSHPEGLCFELIYRGPEDVFAKTDEVFYLYQSVAECAANVLNSKQKKRSTDTE